MAWQEIPEEPYVPNAPFLKMAEVFAKVGDKLIGIYEGDAVSTGQFGGQNYTLNTAAGRICLTVKGGLEKQLAKAELGKGALVAIQLREKKDIGKENRMNIFKVMVDREYKGAPPKNGPNVVIPVRDAVVAADPENDPFA